jgi:hypothetical protein
MTVITLSSGAQTFVASRRPPSPVSITATSTRRSAKYWNAIAVVTSKKVPPMAFACSISGTASLATSASEIAAPLILIRSLKRRIWGEV